MLFVDIDKALNRAKERAAANQADEEYLLELLQISFGIHKQTRQTIYRPYYAAAKWLEQSRRDQSVTQADNIQFTGQSLPIRSLLGLQFALDQDLEIPKLFRINIQVSPGELKDSYDYAITFFRRLMPRGSF